MLVAVVLLQVVAILLAALVGRDLIYSYRLMQWIAAPSVGWIVAMLILWARRVLAENAVAQFILTIPLIAGLGGGAFVLFHVGEVPGGDTLSFALAVVVIVGGTLLHVLAWIDPGGN